MFYYISGVLMHKGENFVVIDVGGVGYKMYTSMSSLQQAGELENKIKMFTYTHVREDIFDLYGFMSPEERSMFEILISVSGVGPKVALAILSTVSSAQFALAVVTNDAKTITKATGVGPKLAQRIILELKDKFKNADIDTFVDNSDNQSIAFDSNSEAISALVVLGYSANEAKNAVSSIYSDGMSIEEIIKLALKKLMK